MEHDHLSAVVRAPQVREPIHEHVVALGEGPLHRVLLHLEWLRHEGLDDEEDDERQDQRLDDLDGAAEAPAPGAGRFGGRCVGWRVGRSRCVARLVIHGP